jgi:hypothetical protein
VTVSGGNLQSAIENAYNKGENTCIRSKEYGECSSNVSLTRERRRAIEIRCGSERDGGTGL